MEDYVARDERPVDSCLADVASADLYVGLLAFRRSRLDAAAAEWQKMNRGPAALLTEARLRQLLADMGAEIPLSQLERSYVQASQARYRRQRVAIIVLVLVFVLLILLPGIAL